jgi:Ser/Thr protein kinase RdoA (MazF antagonist)
MANPSKLQEIGERQRILAIANRFELGAPAIDLEPLGQGNINDTFLVHASNGERAVLQRINNQVFRQPAQVMANLDVLTQHAAMRLAEEASNQQQVNWQLPRPIACRGQGGEGKAATFLQESGQHWRMLTFVPDAICHDTVQSPSHAHEVGRALGRFHQLVHDLPTERLIDTLEGFHVTPRYLENYRLIQQTSTVPQCRQCDACSRFVEQRLDLVPVLEQARAEGLLQPRTIHGDPKVNNVLISSKTGCAVALVDLDTVKPGLLHYDIGDCLRSGCNPVGEETTNLETVHFDLDLCRQILGGYIEVAGSCLSDSDFDNLYNAIRLLPFELGLRFYTDHLAGNVYFKTQHLRHNLDRAMVQFTLTESIEKQEYEIRHMINELRAE